MSENNFTQQQVDTLSRMLHNLHQTNNNPMLKMKIYEIKVYSNERQELYLSYFNEFPQDAHTGIELFLIQIDAIGNNTIMNDTMDKFQIQKYISNLTEIKLK